MEYIGEYPEDFTTVTVLFTTHDANGAPVAPLTAFEAADVKIYKNGSATEKTTTNGLTMTSPFDSIVGLHCLVIDTSNDTGDSGFWTASSTYCVVLNPDSETVNGQTALKVIATFGIALVTVGTAPTAAAIADAVWDEARSGHTTSGSFGEGVASVQGNVTGSVGSVSGAVGSVSGNVGGSVASVSGNVGGNVAGSVGSVVGLTASNLDATISSRASATNLATVAGYIDTEVADIKTVTDHLATALELDGAVYRFTTNALEQAPTGGSAPTASDIADEVETRTIAAVTVVNGLANDVVTAASLAGDAGTEIAAAVWGAGTRVLTAGTNIALAKGTGVTGFNDLDAAGVRTAVGLASANLDTQLGAIDDYIDSEVAAIKAKTDNLPASPAAVGDIPTANQNAEALLDRSAGVETSLTVRQAMRLMVAVLLGKASGLATTTAVFRDTNDSKDRVTATVDADGNRSAVTLDAT